MPGEVRIIATQDRNAKQIAVGCFVVLNNLEEDIDIALGIIGGVSTVFQDRLFPIPIFRKMTWPFVGQLVVKLPVFDAQFRVEKRDVVVLRP